MPARQLLKWTLTIVISATVGFLAARAIYLAKPTSSTHAHSAEAAAMQELRMALLAKAKADCEMKLVSRAEADIKLAAKDNTNCQFKFTEHLAEDALKQQIQDARMFCGNPECDSPAEKLTRRLTAVVSQLATGLRPCTKEPLSDNEKEALKRETEHLLQEVATLQRVTVEKLVEVLNEMIPATRQSIEAKKGSQ